MSLPPRTRAMMTPNMPIAATESMMSRGIAFRKSNVRVASAARVA